MEIPESLQSVVSGKGDKAGFIADKIEECYRAAQVLFGGNFEHRTKPIRVALQALIENGRNTAGAGLLLLKEAERRGDLDAMWILLVSAVVYDMATEGE